MSGFIKFILLILVFIRPFVSGKSEPSSNWFILLILLLLLLLHLARIVRSQRSGVWSQESGVKSQKVEEKSYSSSLDFPLFLFSIAIIIGLFNSFSKIEAIEEGACFLSYFLLFFLIIHYPPSQNWARFFILLSCFLVSCYGIYQSLIGFSHTKEFISQYNLPNAFLGRLSLKKVFSTFIYPNSFAGYLVLIIPLALSFLLSLKKRFYLVLWCSGALVLLYALYLTGSRGGFISLFFSLFLFLVVRKKRILSFISLSFFLLVLIYYCIPPPSSLIARLGYARTSIEIIKNNLDGTGLATFPSMYFKYKKAKDEETRMAHNNYLQIGVELGIFGLMAFLLLLIFIASKGLKLASENPSLEGYYIGSLTFFFHSLVDFDLYLPEITFILFFFLGMFFSFKRKEHQSTRAPEHQSNKLFSFVLIVPVILLCFYSYKMFKASSLYENAMDCIFINKYSPAEIYLQNAVRLNKNPEWLILLGKMKEEKDITESLRLYRMAQSENPNCAYYNFCLAKALIKNGKNQEAMSFLKRAVFLYPTNHLYKIFLKKFYEKKFF